MIDKAFLSLFVASLVAALPAATLHFAGDSTLDDYGRKTNCVYRSWGTALERLMAPGNNVRNLARSGASTKSFVADGLWARLIAEVKPGDYVAIEFGHNDQKRYTEFYREKRWADPKGLFREIIRGWAKEIRAKGATPLMVSPIRRANFDKAGQKLVDAPLDGVRLGDYRDAACELAQELGCDFVDMYELTRAELERLGKDEALKCYHISTGLIVGKDGEPSKDTTHPIQAGADCFARLFLQDVTQRKLAVAKLFGPAACVNEAPFALPAIRMPNFPARDFPITAYGAKSGVKATQAFAAAMKACSEAGGGRVVVPEGRWLTGAVHFKSNCDLHLAEGAVLEFSDDPADYPEVFTTWEGIECYNHSPLLYAYDVENVAITGTGTLAPRMDFWRTWFARPPEHMAATKELYFWCSTNAPVSSRRLMALDRAHMRPHLMQFNRTRGILLEDFRVRESPFWMIHLYHSEDCVVRRLNTYAHGHNNDGVDVDMTKRVLIENCHFDQGDDGIVIKAGRNADAWRLNRCSENIVVRDCDLVESHSLLGIGSELSGGVRNVWMTRCTVADTYSMLRIKTGPRRGGFVENIWIDHCRGKKMVRVFNIFTSYCAQWGAFPDFELRRTRIRNIHVSDLTVETADYGVELMGDATLPPEHIRVCNVRVQNIGKAYEKIENCKDVEVKKGL